MGRLRRAIFFIFVAIYLVVAPLTILYALGYIFNPLEQKLLQTGLVRLTSEPTRAQVLVNGSLLRDKTPLVLRNLKPGVYEIQLTLSGRHPWRKKVEVKANQVLRLENVLLFPHAFRPEILGNFPIAKMWHVSGSKYLFILRRGERASGLYLLNQEENEFQPVFAHGVDPLAKVQEVYLHPSGEEALAAVQIKGVLHPMLVKLTNPLEVTSVPELALVRWTQLQWSSRDKNLLFYLKGGALKRLDLSRGRPSTTLVKQVRGFTLRGRRLYVLDDQRRFFELTQKGEIRNRLLDDRTKARLIFGPEEGAFYSISFLPNPFLPFLPTHPLALFLSNRGKLISNKLPYFLDEGASQLALANSHPWMAYRKGFELWTIDFEQEREEAFFENGPAPRQIFKGKSAPANLTWFYNDQYLLFSEGNRLKVRDFRGEEKGIELFEISERVPQVVLDKKRGFLYFLEPERDRLARVKLFEKEGFLPRLVDEIR